MSKPKDHVPLEFQKPDQPLKGEAIERQTFRLESADQALGTIGKRFEGLDGKRYLGSLCVHIYDIPSVVIRKQVLFYSQSTDLREIPEITAQEAIKELARSIMVRYGRKPPRKTTDKTVSREDGVL